MMKFILGTILVSSISTVALAEDFLSFGEAGRDMFKREVSVFIDKEAVSPKCRCHRFSVAVDDTILAPGRMNTGDVAIVEKRNGEVKSMTIKSLSTVYRHLTSPKVTSQSIFMYDGEETEFEIVTLARACLNPGYPECDNLESRTIGTFKASDLAKLNSIFIDELKK